MMQSKKLLEFPEIYHHFGTVTDPILETKELSLIMMDQPHDDKIKVVKLEDQGKIIAGVDGLITSSAGVHLCVRTADCLPILFYAPAMKVIAVGHAGWRGTLRRISQKIILRLIETGVEVENIFIAIGPHIGSCCYTVGSQRWHLFRQEFGDKNQGIQKRNGKYFLDLGILNYSLLIELGVPKDNIDLFTVCTACNQRNFYSYRRDQTARRMVNIIGFKNKYEN